MNAAELRALAVFKDVPEDVLKLFPPLLKSQDFKAGEAVFAEGSPDDRLFVIAGGEVEIRKKMDADRHKLIAVLQRGEFFGEMAVFLGHPRSADAVAKTDARLLSISRADLEGLFRKSPESAVKVMESLASALMRRLDSTTRELVAVHETGRLIAAARDLRELASCVVEGLMRSVETSRAGMFVLWNDFNGEFEVALHQGFKPEMEAVLPADDPVVGWFSGNQEPFLSPDMASDKRFSLPAGSPYLAGAAVAAPFFKHGRMTGFVLLSGPKGAFSYNHMVLLSAISSHVSVAVENLHFVQEEVDRARLSQAKSSVRF